MNDFILREPDALKIFCQFGEDKWRYFMPNLSQENNAASMLLIAPVLDEAASEHVKSDARTIIPIRKENLNSAILMADRRDALDLIPKNGVVAEIGVAYGGFSEKILEVLNPNVFYAVDRYNVTPGYEVWGLTILKDSGKTHYDWYVDKFRIPIEEGRMVVKQGDSWDVIQTFNDRSLDYVYLDAGHDYESVKRDLSALTGKIKIGGYLQVNDYTSTSYLDDLEYGVVKAVNEFLSESSHQVKALCLHNYGYHDLLIEIHQ